MKYDPEIHNRRSIRLKGYDYSDAGMYYVTVCVKDRKCLFADIVEGVGVLSEVGKIVERCWLEIPTHFLNCELDQHIVMPNHLHGILILKDQAPDHVGVEYIQPQRAETGTGQPQRDVPAHKTSAFQHVIPHSVGSIIRSFKAAVTRNCRRNGLSDFSWQRNYYDHITRDGKDLDRIREYILENPANWKGDEEYPGNVKLDNLRK